MTNWNESVFAVALAAVVLGALFLVTDCTKQESQNKADSAENAATLKKELAAQGMSAREIRCITKDRADVLLCLNSYNSAEK